MRVILDTNILISALIMPGGVADHLYQCWRAGRFRLLTCETQLDEFRRVTRCPKLQKHLSSAASGTMLNQIRTLAEVINRLPAVAICTDPADNFLIAMAEAGKADYLITGDGRHLLSMKQHRMIRIISAREAANMLAPHRDFS